MPNSSNEWLRRVEQGFNSNIQHLHQEKISSVLKKVTVKSDIWYIESSVVQSNGFQESPLFGTESTKFYWRVEKGAPYHTLYLYLAACKEEKIQVDVKLLLGFFYPANKFSFKGEISLDKTKTVGMDNLSKFSLFTATEITFEEMESDTPQLTQLKHNEALCSQLATFRENINSSDIRLLTTLDRREFPAHKWMLASRSTVFAAMFQHGDLVENKKNQVEIDDVTGEVMDALLKYIYSADVQGIEKVAESLLPAADKYDLPLLVHACVESLQSSLSVENALRFFILADLHHLEGFKEEAVKFIEPNLAAIRE